MLMQVFLELVKIYGYTFCYSALLWYIQYNIYNIAAIWYVLDVDMVEKFRDLVYWFGLLVDFK